MSPAESTAAASSPRGPREGRWRGTAPAFVLLLVSPIVVEVLFGSTYVTIFDSLLVEIPFYGGGALLIREVVRRRRLGWEALVALGIAFAVFEEFLVIQTSVSPLLFVGSRSLFVYGRLFGVNWVYAAWAVGYESLWGIVLPVYLTELAFPGQRAEPWLGRPGLLLAGLLFLFGSLAAWAVYTREVVPAALGYVYSPSPVVLGLASALIVGLVAAVLAPTRPLGNRRWPRAVAARPWTLGGAAFGLGLLWFGLVAFAFDLFPRVPPVASLGVAVVLAGVALTFLGGASARPDWSDRHRLAVAFGALLASMIAGYWASGISGTINLVGKGAFDGVAVVLLVLLSIRVRGRDRPRPPSAP